MLLGIMTQRLEVFHVGFLQQVKKIEGKKAEGRSVAEGGCEQNTSGRGDKTTPDLIR